MSALQQIEALKAAPLYVARVEVSKDHPDEALLKAWNKRQETLAIIESRGTFYDCEDHSPAEMELFDLMDEAIVRIIKANTIEGVIVKLWVTLDHMGVGNINHPHVRVMRDAIRRADVEEIMTFMEELEADAQALFSVMMDLLSMTRFERVYQGRLA